MLQNVDNFRNACSCSAGSCRLFCRSSIGKGRRPDVTSAGPYRRRQESAARVGKTSRRKMELVWLLFRLLE